MGSTLIEELLTGDSKQIRDLVNNEAALVGFLTLVKQIDDMPDMEKRFYEDSRSLYQATAVGLSMADLAAILNEFFGDPAKAAGKGLPVSLRFEPTVKHLGGIRKDQTLFLKKLKSGSFYGALFPWQRDPQNIEIHLGFCSPGISGTDVDTLGTLVSRFLSQKKMETISDVGGQIHGISLPSFLQMSEMEGATYTLNVTSGNRTGRLYLDDGSLIAAQYGELNGNAAAYRIISWDRASIQIEAADPERFREIHDPLMHVMMESLKIKDEEGAAAPPPDPSVPPPAPQPAPPRPKAEPPSKPKAKPEVKAKSKTKSKAKATVKPDADRAVPPTAEETPPASPEKAGAFRKPTDRSVGRQDQMSRLGKLLIVLGVVCALAAVAVFANRMYGRHKLEQRYGLLLADLAAAGNPDARIVILTRYLHDHPDDSHRGEIELRLNEARAEIEKADYDSTILAVSRLPLDQKYEQRALDLYTAFLDKYPQSPYAPQINEAIGGIRELLGTAYFEDLKKVGDEDYLDRYAAYRRYLEQFPEGAKRKVVERMITSLAESYARTIESKAESCDAAHDWDDCLTQCERFLSAFSDQPPAKRITALAGLMRDKRDLADIADQASRTGDDFAAARKIYLDYLKAHPQSTQKLVIADRIAGLTEQLERKTKWAQTRAYANDASHDIVDRIRRLKAYLEENPASPYAGSARELVADLQPDFQRAIMARKAAEARRQLLARQQAERVRAEKARQRIARLQASAAAQLRAVSSRYKDNGDGTVTDRVTGLVWSLLDSTLELGTCIDYPQAKAYVRGLRTGGHSDWRLPNAGELATIYKNPPYFPPTGADWYWTSESFARGYHRVVDVVTTTPETVFERASRDENSCGAVRAVRR